MRSSLTGTFGGSITNSAQNRSYPFTYTINSANTWEYETITIAGDTTGTWLTTNGVGMYVRLSLGSGTTFSGTAGAWSASALFSATGATSVVGTSGATFYITGVQLEVGSSATGFEYRDYGNQLIQCQRYYETIDWSGNKFILAVSYASGVTANGYLSWKVTKRTAPTLAATAQGSGRFVALTGSVNNGVSVTFTSIAFDAGSFSTVQTYAATVGWVDSLGTLTISAEL